ncbi:flagellar biosynthesis regulator FlaF [Arenibaculum sp.]|jgi:flagellar protein FlaF|uniref:flagellar biosynthesis regulator FlaF n=1 Tax=Arenibaculum sp. TaxID=2865862 RepID=UPI002E10D376|nr:flagellar biosynthesis regulator FlaF [Arenibaculum sp.]
MSIAAYQQTIAETEDPRRIEYRVFLRITVQLEKHLGACAPTEELKSVLWRNQELWSALRADLMSPDNALPGALKAALVSLSFSVDRHTVRVLDGSADIRLLVDVNRSVMQGLQGILPAGTEMAHGT